MPSMTADSPQSDWDFSQVESAWTWPEDNPHSFQYMEGVVPFRSPKGEVKECPECHRVVRFSIGMCPLCGYDEEDWQVPSHLAAEGEPFQWGDWVEPTAMEKLREQRSGPHQDLECHNCHTQGGMIFDPLNEWARCNNCGARTPVSGDMPIGQKLNREDFMHFYEDPESGEPLSPGEAFVPGSPDVAWPGLNNFGPRRQGGVWDGLNRMVNGPAYQPPAEDMSGLSQHCYFHPDRPAVAHEGFAAMCLECLERHQQSQHAVQQ